MAKPIKKKTINTAKTQITTISTVLRKVLEKKMEKNVLVSSIKNLALDKKMHFSKQTKNNVKQFGIRFQVMLLVF